MRNLRLLLACCLCSCLLVAGTSVGAEPMKASPKAMEHFEAGLAHIDDPSGPKYEEAYREFKAAYAETPSHEIAYNVGFCAFYLERDAEALEMYEIYFAKAKDQNIPRQKRIQVQKDIQALRSGLVTVELKVTPPNATLTDERYPTKGANVINRYPIVGGSLKQGIHPGSRKLTLSADGYVPQSWELDASPGSRHSREIQLVAVAAEKPADQALASGTGVPSASPASTDATAATQTKAAGTSPLVYVGLAATGVFAAGAVGMGLLTNSKKSDFEAVNDGKHYAEAEGLRSDVKTYALVTDICIGAAVLSAGATAYFYFACRSSATEAAPKSAWQLAPVLGKSNAGVAVLGSF